jgi:TonB family protein
VGRIPPFETAFLLSLLLHILLWRAVSWKEEMETAETALIEIDLTRPFRLTDDPKLARRAEKPGTGAPIVTNPSTLPGTPKKIEPPKEWVLPGPHTKILEKPSASDEAPPSSGLGGLGDGTGEGEVDWVHLTELPKMLNRDELLSNIRRFYPEAERRAGNEGLVVLDIHIDSSGRVGRVEIKESAGSAFDAAARRVIAEARFSPARVGSKTVAVKIRQSIAFQLETQ